MRILCIVFGASLLAACATPQPVVDTAALVAKMSNDMDRSVTRYVGSLKTARAADARRLQELRIDADRNRGPMHDQVEIMTLAEDARSIKVLKALALPADPDPLRPGVTAPEVAPAPVTFDGAPLQAVAKIANDIAQPKSAAEQLIVLLAFATTVNTDLQKAAAENSKTDSPPSQP